MAAITAKARASLRLQASTSLSAAEALSAVKEAAGQVKGGGASLLTTGIQNIGAAVHVEREDPSGLKLSIHSGKRLVELCTFSARVTGPDSVGRTELIVGGLETYRTSQEKVLMFIPVGPKQIAGMSPYKRYLDAIASVLTAKDVSARVTVAVPPSA